MEQQYVSIETKDDVSLNNFSTEVRNNYEYFRIIE